LLAGLEDVANEAADAAHAVQGRLRVNADPWFARWILAPRLSTFLAAHAPVYVKLFVRDT
jgi:DNA-binding transcriptional LysR family regulator